MTTPPPSVDEQPIQDRLTRALGAQYEVRSLLGRGGFAEVYEVWDKSLDRRLAVKVLRPDIAWTPGMLSRFKQEAKAVASLAHPNILPIHFVGEGNGLVYYAMPFVEGQSLGDLIRTEGRLDPDRALNLARPIFDALEHAHQKGLVHRDIKPENIMIDRASGRPMLVDFGIAKQMEGGQGGKTGKGLTQTGFVVGTPHYMSPEQALGQGGVDARSDIYAMGAVLFQMVTGTPPFEGETSQEIVAQHITSTPPLASNVDAKVPRWLSDVIVRCLAKRPADRFNTASHAARALTMGRMSGPQDAIPADRIARAVDQDRTAVIPTAEREAARQRKDAAGPGDGPRRRGAGLVVALVLVLAVASAAAWYLMRPVLLVQNQLVEPVELTVGGQHETVAAGGELRIPLSGVSGPIPWVLIRPTTPSGTPMGVEMGGSIATEGVRGRTTRVIDGRTSEQPAFAPLITNASSQPIAITVNSGLTGALDCRCLIPAGANRSHIGYYSLYQNSGVQARNQTGRTAGFGDLGPDVDPVSGTVGLRFEDKDFR